MGYIVSGEGSIVIPNDRLEESYIAMCELNKHDELKTGGSSVFEQKPFESRSLSSNTNIWFSWMDWNYDETCTTAAEILESIGFDTVQSTKEDTLGTKEDTLEIFFYGDSKMGAEHHFLNAIAPFVKDESQFVWTGEDGEIWRYYFKNGEMSVQEAQITWV